MKIFDLTSKSIPAVAKMMCTIKPEWWDYEGAYGQEIDNIADAIASLECDRIDYKWYLEHGFQVIGIQPNAYERGFHLIMLGKDLCDRDK